MLYNDCDGKGLVEEENLVMRLKALGAKTN
jgi:hypothetical protein